MMIRKEKYKVSSYPTVDSLDQNAIRTHVKSQSPRKDGRNEANTLLPLLVVRSVESSKRERFSSPRKGRLIPRECDLSLHKRRRAAQNYKRHAVPLASTYIYIYIHTRFASKKFFLSRRRTRGIPNDRFYRGGKGRGPALPFFSPPTFSTKIKRFLSPRGSSTSPV